MAVPTALPLRTGHCHYADCATLGSLSGERYPRDVFVTIVPKDSPSQSPLHYCTIVYPCVAGCSTQRPAKDGDVSMAGFKPAIHETSLCTDVKHCKRHPAPLQ